MSDVSVQPKCNNVVYHLFLDIQGDSGGIENTVNQRHSMNKRITQKKKHTKDRVSKSCSQFCFYLQN